MEIVQPGWHIVDAEGTEIGRVDAVGDRFLEVEEGLLAAERLYIPLTAVESAAEGAVTLNVTRDEVDAVGWVVPPQTLDGADLV
jgi:hypothetical protein